MRRSILTLTVVSGAVALATGAVAYALSSAQTTFRASARITPALAGTAGKAKAGTMRLVLRGGTTTAGTPATTARFKIGLPKALGWYGKKWPRKRRCSKARAQATTDSACPRASRLGGGSATLVAESGPGQPTVTEELALRAYVLTNGNLGVWAEASTPTPVRGMLEGRVRGRALTLSFPKAFQDVNGVPGGFTKLSLTLNGRTRSKGKTYAFVMSTACHPFSKDKTWAINVTNFYADGGRRFDVGKSRCVKPG